MAQLKDLIVNGDARIIGKLYASQSMPDGVFHLANVGGTAAVTSSPYTASKGYTTADDPRITSLYSGLTISLKIPVAGNGSYGTLLNVNGLGDHPVVYNINSYISTRYAVGGTIHLTYNATQTATAYNNGTSATTYTGCWQMEDYDSTNTYQLKEGNGYMQVGAGEVGSLYRYQLCLTNRYGQLVPYNNVNNATTNYTKTLTSEEFDPFAPIYYYNSTTAVSTPNNAAASALFTHVNFDCRYSMNIQSDGTAGTTALYANDPVYIMANYNTSTGSAQLIYNTSSSSYAFRSGIINTSLAFMGDPSELGYPNLILIYLGRATSKYQIEISQNHPVYKYNSQTGIGELFGGGGGSVEPASQETLGTLRAGVDTTTNTLYLSNEENIDS